MSSDFIPMLFTGALTAVATAIAVRCARGVALRKQLLDLPNERSSHNRPVPRLGGAAFVPVIVAAGILAAPSGTLPLSVRAAMLSGVGALYLISLVDDFISLSAGVCRHRFPGHKTKFNQAAKRLEERKSRRASIGLL